MTLRKMIWQNDTKQNDNKMTHQNNTEKNENNDIFKMTLGKITRREMTKLNDAKQDNIVQNDNKMTFCRMTLIIIISK